MQGKNILIAEDESIIFIDLKMLLQNHGYIISAVVLTGENLLQQYQLKKPFYNTYHESNYEFHF